MDEARQVVVERVLIDAEGDRLGRRRVVPQELEDVREVRAVSVDEVVTCARATESWVQRSVCRAVVQAKDACVTGDKAEPSDATHG